jgi:predicted nuclease of predicted toxin-antitoxin system
VAERIKLYTDEHAPRAVVRGLRERGVDTLTVSEAGMLGASDEEHLAFARGEGRVLFTQDDDLLRLHASGVEHAGIVSTRDSQQP